MTTETTTRFDVVGTDEDMRYAYVWLRDPDLPLPAEEDVRRAIVETAANEWDQPLVAELVKPWTTQWFKDGPDDEECGCAPDDPDRRSFMWLWHIDEAVFQAEFGPRTLPERPSGSGEARRP